MSGDDDRAAPAPGAIGEDEVPGGGTAEFVVLRGWRRWFPGDPTRFGQDPDYRFTLANERTFLAWVRTALALAAGGLGTVVILDDFTGGEALGITLLALSFVTAATAYRRWALNELAMRVNRPLPPSRLPLAMAVAVAVVALLAATLLVIDAS